MSSEHGHTVLSCVECGAKCCRYLAVEIDEPTSKKEYDYIRWHLLHKDVHIFIDHDGDWFIEFETPCEGLGEDHLCHNYEHRPQICRDHGEEDDHAQCEFHSDEEPHTHRFSCVTAFEDYLDAEGIDWRIREKQRL